MADEKRPTLSGGGGEDYIETETGQHVPRLDLEARFFVDQMAILYGATKSGKSHMIRSILYTLRQHVDQIIVVSPQESANRAYEGIVDKPLIWQQMWIPDPKNPKKEDGAKGTERFLQAIWDRQEMLSRMYADANLIDPLSRLFMRLSKPLRQRGAAVIAKIRTRRQEALAGLRTRFAADTEALRREGKTLDEKFTHMLALVYKKFIIVEREQLFALKDLTAAEITSLTYLELNPRIVLVLEDCAADLKPLNRKAIFRKLFYQGRHNFITCLIAVQDDTDIDANLRKNALVSIYTKPEIAESNFTRVSNKYTKATVSLVKSALPKVFVGHRKMAYLQSDATDRHVYHVTAPSNVPSFKFGSKALHELCELVACREPTANVQNPYYSLFKVQP